MKLASHKKGNAALFHLYEVSSVVTFIETESTMVVGRDQ